MSDCPSAGPKKPAIHEPCHLIDEGVEKIGNVWLVVLQGVNGCQGVLEVHPPFLLKAARGDQ